MKITFKSGIIKKSAFLLLFTVGLVSCSSDDDHIDDGFQGKTADYELTEVANSTIEGKMSFQENKDGSTTIDIELEGTDEEKTYTPVIRHGNSVDGGEVAITLKEVEGSNGSSTTTVSKLDDDTPVTFEQLIALNGHVSIYYIEDETEVVVAQTDLGENQLTGESISYDLNSEDEEGPTGTVRLQERENGQILVTVFVEGTEDGSSHPVTIHSGAIGEEQGEAVITLNPVVDGWSFTNVSNFDGEEEESVTYEELIDFDGSVNVYNSEEKMESPILQANIGSNVSAE